MNQKIDQMKQMDRREIILGDFYNLVYQAPSLFALYNGVGAGASIPSHLHFHFVLKPQDMFPLEIAAKLAEEATGAINADLLYVDEPFYPLTAFRTRGDRESIISKMMSLIKEWREIAGENATENMIAIAEEEGVCMYYVPRDKRYRFAAGFAGEIGGLEVLGEFVFSTEDERRLLMEGRLNYDSLRGILQAVRPLQSSRLRHIVAN